MTANRPEQMILASASPRRRELMARHGLDFEVVVADVDELEDREGDPEAMVRCNAQAKARKIAALKPDTLVLGSDTTVWIGGEVLNKPVDLAEARAMLGQLSGREHCVFTAVCMIWEAGDFREAWIDTSRVRFKPLTSVTIEAYFSLVNPLDKAGAYGIQEGREMVIDGLSGHLSTVMGLPIEQVCARLARFGWLETFQTRQVSQGLR